MLGTMFLLLSRYLKPSDDVDRALAAHREFLDRYYKAGLFIVSGPQNPRTGGVIVTAECTRDEVEAALAEDPFLREGISEYQIVEFAVTKQVDWFRPGRGGRAS
jgi:uncharacterized protein YciI